MNKVDEIIEEKYQSIKKVNRIFYPRNFELDEDFIQLFQLQVEELRESGMDDKAILAKMIKALEFHMPETANS